MLYFYLKNMYFRLCIMENNDMNLYTGFFSNQRSTDMILKIFFCLLCFLMVLFFAAWHITRKTYKLPPLVKWKPEGEDISPLETILSRSLQRKLTQNIVRQNSGSTKVTSAQVRRETVISLNSAPLIHGYLSRKRMDNYFTFASAKFCHEWRGLLFSRYSPDRSVLRRLSTYAYEDLPSGLLHTVVNSGLQRLPIATLPQNNEEQNEETVPCLTGQDISDLSWFIISRLLVGPVSTSSQQDMDEEDDSRTRGHRNNRIDESLYEALHAVCIILRCLHLGLCREVHGGKGDKCWCPTSLSQATEGCVKSDMVIAHVKLLLQPLIQRAMNMDVLSPGTESSDLDSIGAYYADMFAPHQGRRERGRATFMSPLSQSAAAGSSAFPPASSYVEQFLLTKTSCEEEEEPQLQFVSQVHLAHLVAESGYVAWECLQVMLRCALLYLATHPHYQERMRQQCHDLRRDLRSGAMPPNTGDDHALCLLKALSYETLRWISPSSMGFNVFVAERDGLVEEFDFRDGDLILTNHMAYFLKVGRPPTPAVNGRGNGNGTSEHSRSQKPHPQVRLLEGLQFRPERYLNAGYTSLVLPKYWDEVLSHCLVGMPMGFLVSVVQFTLLGVCDHFHVDLHPTAQQQQENSLDDMEKNLQPAHFPNLKLTPLV